MKNTNAKRLWNTNTKKFIKEFAILQTVNSDGNIEHTYFERNPKTLELERLSTCHIEEQNCSGVKDKNGKLIYEGDIVNIRDYSALGYPRSRIGEVEFWYSETYPAFYVTTIHGDAKDFTDDMEVIGNKFENPELLKEVE